MKKLIIASLSVVIACATVSAHAATFKKIKGTDGCEDQAVITIDRQTRTVTVSDSFASLGAGEFPEKKSCYVDRSGDQHKRHCRWSEAKGTNIRLLAKHQGLLAGIPLSTTKVVVDLNFNADASQFVAVFDVNDYYNKVTTHHECLYQEVN